MLYKVSEFCAAVSSNLNGFIDHLTEITGRRSPNEIMAWQNSLPKISKVLSNEVLSDLNLYIPPDGNLLVEYRLPSSSSWCDLVLLGQKNDVPSVLIIELKDWQTNDDEPGTSENLIFHQGSLYLHPSDQVRGYVNYCRRFHSAILDNKANVSGCVYFTKNENITAYSRQPHVNLTQQFPVFSNGQSSDQITNFVIDKLDSPNESFAQQFANGTYKQDRNLVTQVAKAFLSNSSPFELLDEQRRGFERAMELLNKAFSDRKNKYVLVISGPPGSGKSALAANLWAAAANKFEGNIVFTTTSGSQRNNWETIFSNVGQTRIATGIVIPANLYNPGISPNWVAEKRGEGFSVEVESWKKNIKLFLDNNANRCPDNQFLLSIVDEAHALIDPSHTVDRGIPPSGFAIHAGPQGWHIIRSSQLSVFLLDGDQRYRDNETTTVDYIEEYAKDFNAVVEHLNLSGTQFRCGESVEYLNWLEKFLQMSNEPSTTSWRKSKYNPKGQFVFELVNYLHELDEVLNKHFKENKKVRLVSSYSKKWKTKNEANPHQLEPQEMDFYFNYQVGGKIIEWSRIWNYAPNSNYTLFVQAPFGSKMYIDPLCEVGCPYVIRGFDYDYLGIIWLGDFVWRDDKWVSVLSNVYETAWPKTKAIARTQGNIGPLTDRLKKSYRIMFSRALKGIYVWIEDEETRNHIKSELHL